VKAYSHPVPALHDDDDVRGFADNGDDYGKEDDAAEMRADAADAEGAQAPSLTTTKLVECRDLTIYDIDASINQFTSMKQSVLAVHELYMKYPEQVDGHFFRAQAEASSRLQKIKEATQCLASCEERARKATSKKARLDAIAARKTSGSTTPVERDDEQLPKFEKRRGYRQVLQKQTNFPSQRRTRTDAATSEHASMHRVSTICGRAAHFSAKTTKHLVKQNLCEGNAREELVQLLANHSLLHPQNRFDGDSFQQAGSFTRREAGCSWTQTSEDGRWVVNANSAAMDAVALERLYRSSSNTVHFLDGDILRYQAKLWGRSQQPQNFNQSTSAGYYVDVCFVSVEERTTATRLSKSRMRKRAAVNTSTETDIAPFMNAKKTKNRWVGKILRL